MPKRTLIERSLLDFEFESVVGTQVESLDISLSQFQKDAANLMKIIENRYKKTSTVAQASSLTIAELANAIIDFYETDPQ